MYLYRMFGSPYLRPILAIAGAMLVFLITLTLRIKSALTFECQVVIENQTEWILDSVYYKYLDNEGFLTLEPNASSDTLSLSGNWPFNPLLLLAPGPPSLHLSVTCHTRNGVQYRSPYGISGNIKQKAVNSFVISPGQDPYHFNYPRAKTK